MVIKEKHLRENTLNPDIKNLPETVIAPRTDAIYNCHSYLTKVPVAAIEPFIKTFTKPGEIVVDFFAGSGMTGLASLIQNRHAQLSDISALGQHISKGYLADVSDKEINEISKIVIKQARDSIGNIYMTTRTTDGTEIEMVRTVWSFTYICPECNSELIYFNEIKKKGAAPKTCPCCKEEFIKRKWGRAQDVPVEIVVRGEDGKQKEQSVTNSDKEKILIASKDPRQKDVPSLTIEKHREMYNRSGLGKAGMTETSMFFSARNAIALLELWQAINNVKDEQIRQKLRFAFTAILPRASRRYQWSAKRPLNAQNQTYYIAPVYYEWNVFELFQRKVSASIRADKLINQKTENYTGHRTSNVNYSITSADDLSHLKNSSIDYVFTDPPFGSNIFYSDMNLFHEAWLGKITDYVSEAVVHTTGNRKNGAEKRYENLLKKSFIEAWRILKPGRYMSVVFGNSSGRIWGLVQRALRDAGFKATPVHVAILDKGQRSVKGLNSGSEGVVTVDLIVTVQKPEEGETMDSAQELTNGDTTELIHSVINELSVDEQQNPSHVYACILRKAIKKHLVLDNLHLSDVLIAIRNAGYSVDKKTGLLHTNPKNKKVA